MTDWEDLAKIAWAVRERSRIIGKTKVGCALLSDERVVVSGCNIEHKYRSHDIHAETNTIGNLIANHGKSFTSIIIVAERDSFTPCGSCMDWIFEIGGADVRVGFQSKPGGVIDIHTAGELMPFYPR